MWTTSRPAGPVRGAGAAREAAQLTLAEMRALGAPPARTVRAAEPLIGGTTVSGATHIRRTSRAGVIRGPRACARAAQAAPERVPARALDVGRDVGRLALPYRGYRYSASNMTW